MKKKQQLIYAGLIILAISSFGCMAGGGHGGGGGGGGNKPSVNIVANPSTSVDTGDTVILTAQVNGDPSNSVTWTLPTGLPIQSQSTTSTTATFVPGPIVCNASSPLQYTFTATSTAFPTVASSITIKVSALPKVTSTTLPDAAVGSPYSTTLQAACGTGAYTWSLTAGGLNPPFGLTLSSNGVLSGTPTGPTGNNQPFNVFVGDSDFPQPGFSDVTQVSMNVNNGPTPPACVLYGQYAFYMSGFDPNPTANPNGAYQLAGSVNIDLNGNAINASLDAKNTKTAFFATLPGVNGITSAKCTNNSQVSNAGTLTLNIATSPPQTRTFAFFLGSTNVTVGRIGELNSANLTNLISSGVIQKQDTNSFSTFPGFRGDYAFGLAGHRANGNRFGIAGEFCSSGPGPITITNAEADQNDNGTPAEALTLAAGPQPNYPAPDANGRTSTRLILSNGSTTTTLGLAFYVVNIAKAFAVEPSTSEAIPIVGGQVVRQAGKRGCAETYTNSSVTTAVFALSGAISGAAYTTIGRISGVNPSGGTGAGCQSGQGSASLVLDANSGGTLTLNNGNGGVPVPVCYSVESTGRGTVTFTLSGTPHKSHFYASGRAGDAFLVDSDSDTGIGFVRAQSATPISSPSGSFAFGTIFTPAPASQQAVGQLSWGGPFSGYAPAAVAGTTAITSFDPSTGRGLVTVNNNVKLFSSSQFVFYVIDPSLILGMGSGNDSGTTDNIAFFDQ